MAGKSLIGATVAGFLAASLLSTVASANAVNLNTGTRIPMRPHVNLNSTIHIDVRSRAFQDIDLSDSCHADDERLKTLKRKRRCRQER